METLERCHEETAINRSGGSADFWNKHITTNTVHDAGVSLCLIPEFEVVVGVIENGNESVKSTLQFHSFVFARKILAILSKDWELAYIRKRQVRDELI